MVYIYAHRTNLMYYWFSQWGIFKKLVLSFKIVLSINLFFHIPKVIIWAEKKKKQLNANIETANTVLNYALLKALDDRKIYFYKIELVRKKMFIWKNPILHILTDDFICIF